MGRGPAEWLGRPATSHRLSWPPDLSLQLLRREDAARHRRDVLRVAALDAVFVRAVVVLLAMQVTLAARA